MKRTISAEIVADSLNEFGDRIITYVLQYPRMIHAELLTHRMFSRNSASSRAIPFKKMVKLVTEDPFIPIAWQKNHKGMQGKEYLVTPIDLAIADDLWLEARDKAVKSAKNLNSGVDVTKQLCNRLLEPFQWYTCLVTATEYDNFFKLRCPKYEFEGEPGMTFQSKSEYRSYYTYQTRDSLDIKNDDMWWYSINKSGAEIHIQALAECMWDAKNESTPKKLKAGEWHIPFGDKFSNNDLAKLIPDSTQKTAIEFLNNLKVKIATARCARISYNNFEGKDDYEADIKLYDRLESMKHASPFEHCAVAMSGKEYEEYHKGRLELDFFQDSDHEFEGYFYDPDITDKYTKCYHGWCRNFKGFINLRHKINL